MFKQILFTQWKWCGWFVVAGALGGFAAPLLSVQATAGPADTRFAVSELLSSVQAWGYLYPILAMLLGLVVALATWSNDHRGRHVYALSLPLPRWYYVLLRFGAGAILLLPAVLGVWIGGLVAAASVTLPTGLHAYPSSMALRFALAAIMAYALIFSISAGTTKTAGYLLGVILGLVFAQVLLSMAGADVNVLGDIIDRLMIWPGPFEVFTGRWMLINV
jgi:hypothetical protein